VNLQGCAKITLTPTPQVYYNYPGDENDKHPLAQNAAASPNTLTVKPKRAIAVSGVAIARKLTY